MPKDSDDEYKEPDPRKQKKDKINQEMWVIHPEKSQEIQVTWNEDGTGIKKVLEYYIDNKTKKEYKIIRTILLRPVKVRISKKVIARQNWSKFGKGLEETKTTFLSPFDIQIEKPSIVIKPTVTASQEKYKVKSTANNATKSNNSDNIITFANTTEKTTTQIKISNLPEETVYDDVKRLCRGFGYIERINIPKDFLTQDTRGMAFVTFRERSAAESALKSLDRRGYGNMILQVTYSIDRKQSERKEHIDNNQKVVKTKPLAKPQYRMPKSGKWRNQLFQDL